MPFTVENTIGPLPLFAVLPGVFTHDEMEQISFLEDLQNFERGTIQGTPQDKSKLEDYRKSKVSWLNPDRNTHWLFRRFSDVCSDVNQKAFKYDLDGFESFQYTLYEKDDHYDWHIDYELSCRKYLRKISATIMVSSPEEYSGGDFEIITAGNLNDKKVLKLNRGDVVFFASWMPHRVAPVTYGKRKSLVAWVMGKNNG